MSNYQQLDAWIDQHFDEEVLKLDHWSDDLKQGLEREIRDLDKEIREARKVASFASSLAEARIFVDHHG